MIKSFQYKVVKTVVQLQTQLETQLNEYGSEGWEVCSISYLSSWIVSDSPLIQESELLITMKKQLIFE